MTISIKVGRRYMTRDGREVGPMKQSGWGGGWKDTKRTITGLWWEGDGRFIPGQECSLDLVEELPEPVEAPKPATRTQCLCGDNDGNWCSLPGCPYPKRPDERPALTFPYSNWRGEHSLRRVLPIRVWFGSTDWHPEPQWFLRALDLDKGEERDFAFSAINKPEPVTEDDDVVGWCEGCAKAIREGERYHACGDGPCICEACAPTYADMLKRPQDFRDPETDEPMHPAQAAHIVASHMAAGGSLEDKVVS